MRTKPVLAILCTGILAFILSSGIIRSDVPEQAYLQLASEPQFKCVARLLKNHEPAGSCVLIDPKHVLTAAHILINSKTRPDTLQMNGQTIITYTPYDMQTCKPEDLSVELAGKTYSVKTIRVHENYSRNIQQGQCDIALLELDSACTNLKPAEIGIARNEKGSLVYGVGFGVSGPADSPESVFAGNKKIAGQNTVDKLGGYHYNGRQAMLICDFDHPQNKDCNKTGSAEALPYEYICGGGDSGGGLFKETNGKWELIGLCSGAEIDIAQLMKTGYYGQKMQWTHVSLFAEWIRQGLNTGP